ncbi:MAG: DUF2946 domain-containing protein [Alphaproteobacteria bacterium]|nr:MAG: DUF2946 domain-containing protein [Alphaproteobacteria bacterium]
MSDRRHRSGWRATALAAALFAITVNFLQPLAHAALMRDGSPSTLWNVFCSAAAASESRQDAPPPLSPDNGKHECCLGLAHATCFAAPAAVSIAIEPSSATVQPLQPIDLSAAGGIRDGPHQPRGPPSFV